MGCVLVSAVHTELRLTVKSKRHASIGTGTDVSGAKRCEAGQASFIEALRSSRTFRTSNYFQKLIPIYLVVSWGTDFYWRRDKLDHAGYFRRLGSICTQITHCIAHPMARCTSRVYRQLWGIYRYVCDSNSPPGSVHTGWIWVMALHNVFFYYMADTEQTRGALLHCHRFPWHPDHKMVYPSAGQA